MASRPPESSPTGDQARQRWMVLNLMRIAGIVLALVGILMTQGTIDLVGEENTLVGYVFIAVGLADAFIVPQVLARKWRTPPQ
jgi:hypothetical protein